jgi:hypothetical protein
MGIVRVSDVHMRNRTRPRSRGERGANESGARGPTAAYTEPVTGTATERPEGPPAAAWLDEGEVNPEWAPPAGDPVRRPPVSGPLVYGGVMLALLLLLAVVWGAGGFNQRTDLLRPIEPGMLISTGRFEFTFTEATAQQQRDLDGNITTWEIVVIGQARTTGDETIAPTYFGDGGMFALRDLTSGTIVSAKSAMIGEVNARGFSPRQHLVPGLPPTGYRLIFELPVSYQPGPTIRFGLIDQVYETRYLVTEEEGWGNGTYGYRLDLPLRVLPPEN